MTVSLHFDRYLRYDDLSAALQGLGQAYPHLLRVASIGQSHEGREIWLATVTRVSTGDDLDKPALWVDGNIHATEVAGSMACLYLIDTLLRGYGVDPEITRCLDSRVFYICPRLNPDGRIACRLAASLPGEKDGPSRLQKTLCGAGRCCTSMDSGYRLHSTVQKSGMP